MGLCQKYGKKENRQMTTSNIHFELVKSGAGCVQDEVVLPLQKITAKMMQWSALRASEKKKAAS